MSAPLSSQPTVKPQRLRDLVLDQSLDDRAFRVASAYLALTHSGIMTPANVLGPSR